MNQKEFKQVIDNAKLHCPTCDKPIKQFEKFVEMTASVWDGAGDSNLETAGAKVTLICANDNCDWRERTEYWSEYIK